MATDTRAPLELPAPPPLVPPDGLVESLAIAIDAPTVQRLGDFLARLLAMNEQMNLTAIVEPSEAWTRHIADALTLAPLLPQGARIVDVGSGGGVPGIPLAIARPDLRVTLVEATQRKAAFLTSVSAALGRTRVTVLAQRAEQLGRPHRAAYDVVTARAVARLATLLPLTVPLAKVGGTLLLVKGQRADEELAEASAALTSTGVVHLRTVLTPSGRIVVLRRDA